MKLFAALILMYSCIGIAKELPTKEDIISLTNISGEQDENLSTVTATFSKPPTYTKVGIEDHGSFVQILLPNMIATQAGEFFEGNSTEVKKIAMFQRTPTTAAIRLFVNNKAHLVKQATEVSILGNRLIASINEKKLKQLAERNKKDEVTNLIEKTKLSEVIKNTSVDKSISQPATLIKGKKTSSEAIITNKKLTIIAGFLALMLVIALTVFTLRSRIKKLVSKSSKKDEAIKLINLLDSQKLNQKQTLQVVSIEGQKILLSVSDENVSFMTNLDQPRPQSPRVREGRQIERVQTAQPKQLADLPARKKQNVVQVKRASATAQENKPKIRKAVPISTSKKTPGASSSINIAIGEDGVKDLSDETGDIEDVTKMIREKLRQFSKQN